MKAIRGRFFISRVLTSLTCFGIAMCAQAEESESVSRPRVSEQRLTGKERLGPKWSDEQRIDNCRVPIDKRGTKIRQDTCPNTPSS